MLQAGRQVSNDLIHLVDRSAQLSLDNDVSDELKDTNNVNKATKYQPSECDISRIQKISSKLTRDGTVNFLTEIGRLTLINGAYLIRQTTIPINIKSSDPHILDAFRTIDNIILSPKDELLKRIAYMRLMSVFNSLKKIVSADRSNGLIHRATGYRDATIAIDIYASAQEKNGDIPLLRRNLLERKRSARRWLQLAGSSPFLLIAYSNIAERIVYVPSWAVMTEMLTS